MVKATLPLGLLIVCSLPAADADLILHNGKIVTADSKFTIAQAVAIKDGRITAIGADDAVLGKENAARARAWSTSVGKPCCQA